MTADDLDLLLRRVERLARAAADDGRRRVLGIAGAPGSGKTTLVELLLAAVADHSGRGGLAGRVAHVPMDGFHLPNAELDRLGRRDRKGAPDTFDTASYAATLTAVRAVPRALVRAPAFDHAMGDPQADGVEVAPEADVVVTEGNYLLLDRPEWAPVRAALDEVWACLLPDEVRLPRLVARHVAAGRGPSDAKAWVSRSDEANARLVLPTLQWAEVLVVDGRVVRPREGVAGP